MSKRNNRSAGHRTEKQVIKLLAEALDLEAYNGRNAATAQIGSSRAFSRTKDANKIDIHFVPEELEKVAIQVKEHACSGKRLSIDAGEMPDTDGLDILISKLTRKSKKGRFMSKGIFVCMRMEDFITLLTDYYDRQKSQR